MNERPKLANVRPCSSCLEAATSATLESRSAWDRWELAGAGMNQQWVRKRERLVVGGGNGRWGLGVGLEIDWDVVDCRFIKLVSAGMGEEGEVRGEGEMATMFCVCTALYTTHRVYCELCELWC